uniref:Lipoprotein n=1 Tax=Strongyloides venezuelensis TaxID=75913 RepID=A0A0K0F9W2_STRVS
MIGLMNCNDASDSVEFYSAPSFKKISTAEDTKLFTEYKDKVHIEYREDGRKMIDGDCEEKKGADKLWSELIMRKTIDRNFSLSRDEVEEDNKKDKNKKNKKNKKCDKHEKKKRHCEENSK